MAGLKLIVGLGNPGPTYSNTRHNAGYWWMEKLCLQQNIKLQKEAKFEANVGSFNIQTGGICFLAQSTNYMNNSGTAVAAISNYYKILPQEILVVHDDLDLECGYAKFKLGGGHAGHNGLRDIMAKLSNPDFYRLRIGISHPGHKDLVHNYVLARPSKEEQNKIEQIIDKSLDNLAQLLQGELHSYKI